MLYQGDLFFAPFDAKIPVGPAQPLTVEFMTKLKQLGLNLERVAGVHGKTVDLNVVKASVNAQPGTVPGGGQ